WHAYLNMASGCPPWSTSTFLPLSLSQVNAGSGARPVRKKPSFSLIWAKCTAGGICPFSSGPKPCDGADWHTCTVPATTPSMADFPRRRDRMARLEPLFLQEAAGDGGDQRRVEPGKAGELDVDLIAHLILPGAPEGSRGTGLRRRHPLPTWNRGQWRCSRLAGSDVPAYVPAIPRVSGWYGMVDPGLSGEIGIGSPSRRPSARSTISNSGAFSYCAQKPAVSRMGSPE